MKKYMQQSRLMKAPGHKQLETDMGFWKLQGAEYYNSRSDEWIRVYKCPMQYRCKCKAQVRVIAGKDYKQLEFYGTHDENSHATDHSKKLKYKQIDAIYDSVMIAPKQSVTLLRHNLMQAKGSPEQHKHMDRAQLRLIQRRVQTAQQEFTKRKLDTLAVPESLGELIG